jgi:DNA-binding response OmpR family regulator
MDLLLLDMHLPKRGGEDILKCLRSTERYAQTPVIVMTASDAPSDHHMAEEHAALHYFRKPANLAEFMELGVIARGVLSGQKARDSENTGIASRRGGGA